MPLVTRRIDTSYAYVDSEKYAKLARFHVLQGTNTASLVGALEQIGLLADYATEIFNDIYKFSSRLNDRISDATTRTSSLLAQLPDVQAQFTSKDLNIYASPALFKQGEQFPETAMLLPSSKPRSLQQYYDSPAMGRIPAVADMDALLPPEDLATRGPCANSYSYPGFFMDEWKKAEAERRKVLEAERQRRRKERAERKQKLKQLKEREAQAVKGKEKKNRLDWRERLSAGPRPSDVPSAAASISEPPKPELLFKRVFEDVDDEEDLDSSQPSAAPKPAVPPPISAAPLASPPVPSSAPPPISIASSAPPSSAAPPSMPPPPPGKAPPPIPAGAPPPPLPSTAPPPPIPRMAPPPMPNSAPPPLPVGAPPPIPSGPPAIPSGPPPILSGPPPIPSGPPPIAPTPPSAPPRMPAPPPPTSPPISPPVSPTAPPNAPPPPQTPLQPPRPAIPPPPLSDEPPIARPPNPFGSGDDARNNLLTSITQGKKLRAAKDEPAPVKQLPGAPPKLDMLTAIRRGSVLRKVETNAPKPPQRKESLGAFSGDAVASILARRKHLQADDTESDEDDDNEW